MACSMSAIWKIWNLTTRWAPGACQTCMNHVKHVNCMGHLNQVKHLSRNSCGIMLHTFWDHVGVTQGVSARLTPTDKGVGVHPTNNPSKALGPRTVGCSFFTQNKKVANVKAHLNSEWSDLTRKSARNHHRATLYCFFDGLIPSLISEHWVVLVWVMGRGFNGFYAQ